MAFETLRERSPLGLARIVGFYLSVLVFVFFWLLAFNFPLGALFYGWFDPELVDTIHFVHDVALASWVWVWGLAMLVQLYEPARRVTAMQVALLMTLTDAGLAVFGTFDPSAMMFFGPIFVAAALHPARSELLGRPSWDSVDPVLLGLVGLAVVPLGLYVVGQANFQLTLADEHAEFGHYGTMVYFGLSILALAALASLRTRGRRLAAYGAAVMAALLGVASVFQPTMSGLSSTWSAITILWAFAVVVAYERSARRTAARSIAGEQPPRSGGGSQPSR